MRIQQSGRQIRSDIMAVKSRSAAADQSDSWRRGAQIPDAAARFLSQLTPQMPLSIEAS